MDQIRNTMNQLLLLMVKQEASDLHISSKSPPELRIDGELVPLKSDPLTPAQTKALCMSLLTEDQRRKFEQDNEIEAKLNEADRLAESDIKRLTHDEVFG